MADAEVIKSQLLCQLSYAPVLLFPIKCGELLSSLEFYGRILPFATLSEPSAFTSFQQQSAAGHEREALYIYTMQKCPLSRA